MNSSMLICFCQHDRILCMDKDVFLKLGYKIKYERVKRKISQLGLAMSTHLTTRTLSRIECGIIDPKYSTLLKIAKALNLDIRDLLDFKL